MESFGRGRPLPEEEAGSCVFPVVLVSLFWGGLSMLLYSEPFMPGVYPLSDLGVPHTVSGIPSPWSCAAFDICLVLDSVLSAFVGSRLLIPVKGIRRTVMGVSLLAAAAGFLLAIAPHNALPGTHAVGSGLAFGGWWLFLTLWIGPGSGGLRIWAIPLQCILQASVFSYAVAYVLDFQGKQLLQAAALSGLIMAAIPGVFLEKANGKPPMKRSQT